MKSTRKIGIGLITYNRPDFYLHVLRSIKQNVNDCFLVIINDGNIKYCNEADGNVVIFNNEQLGVAKTKNKALTHLLNQNCTDLFIIEDDVIVKNSQSLHQYIKTSEATNIPHLSFGPVEITSTYPKNLKLTCMYSNNTGVDLYHHPQGGLMYFNITKMNHTDCMFDENFINAFEHVDMEFNLIQKSMQPPFWYFPDIYNSLTFIESIKNSSTESTITNKHKYEENVRASADYFIKKWGIFTNQIPDVGTTAVINILKKIKTNNSK